MIDPKTNSPVLLALQEVATSATEMAETQRRRFSHLLGVWKEPRDLRVQVALVALEDRRMAARRKILAELYRLDRLRLSLSQAARLFDMSVVDARWAPRRDVCRLLSSSLALGRLWRPRVFSLQRASVRTPSSAKSRFTTPPHPEELEFCRGHALDGSWRSPDRRDR